MLCSSFWISKFTKAGFFTAGLPRAPWVTKEGNAESATVEPFGKSLCDYLAPGWERRCWKLVTSPIESFWFRAVEWRGGLGSVLITARKHRTLSTGQGSLRAIIKAVEFWRACIPQTLFQSCACLWRGLFGYLLTSDPNSNPSEDSEKSKTTRGNTCREGYSGPLYLIRCLILTPCSIYFYSNQITKHLYRQWKFCNVFAKQTQGKYSRVNRNPRSSPLLVLEPSV